MLPIVIKGHERPLTQLKYNREGDLLISTARDKTVSVWFSDDGERLGTLGPHEGAVMSVDVDQATRFAITGASDRSLRVWSLNGGQELFRIDYQSTPRFVELSPDNKRLLVIVDEQMKQIGQVIIYDVDFEGSEIKLSEVSRYTREKSPFIQASWTYDGNRIIAAHRDGSVSRINCQTGEVEANYPVHKMTATDLQMSPDRTYFVTSSRDSTACLSYVDGDLAPQKTYKGDVPLNSAAITPVKDIVIAGGGIDAREVTRSSDGRFESHFFHKIYMDDLGRLGGHFGPINTISVHPFGTSYASGSEDGYVRIHHFDKNYFEFGYGMNNK